MSSDKRFSTIILDRLKELGWSKSDLARRLQVTPSRVNNVLRQPNITEDVMMKITNALGLRITFVEVGRPAPPAFEGKKNSKMVA